MEKVSIYKYNIILVYVFLGFGILNFVFGSIMLFLALRDGFSTKWDGGDWNAIFSLFQGLLFIAAGFSIIHSKRYFIEWNDKVLIYRTIESKKTMEIMLDQISDIQIRIYNIDLNVDGQINTIYLGNSGYKELVFIKEKFAELQESMAYKSLND